MNELGKFFAKVEKCADGCWMWTGTVRDKASGYGDFCTRRKGKTIHRPAHRYSWELHNGPVPVGLYVCHTCDVRLCVNPAHLWLGTHAENQADKVAKGRGYHPFGSLSTKAKLTEAQVLEIRRRRAAGERGVDLAKEFVVSPSLINLLHKRKAWTHV